MILDFFTDRRVIADLTALYDEAYIVTKRRYAPQKYGDNELSFGVMLWRMLTRQLSQFAQMYSEHVTFSEISNSAALLFDKESLVKTYRLDTAHGEDIWSWFPRNEHTAGQLAHENAKQLFLLPHDESRSRAPNPENLKKWVLGHTGDIDSGFQGLYLASPIENSLGKVTRWHTAHELWDRQSGEILVPTTRAYDEQPDAAPIPDGTIKFRHEKKRHERE